MIKVNIFGAVTDTKGKISDGSTYQISCHQVYFVESFITKYTIHPINMLKMKTEGNGHFAQLVIVKAYMFTCSTICLAPLFAGSPINYAAGSPIYCMDIKTHDSVSCGPRSRRATP